MVIDELTDGKQIGQYLASEVHGHERDVLGELSVVDADKDAESSENGTFAFAVATRSGNGSNILEAYLHPDRLRVEVLVCPAVAADVGVEEGLRTRPKAVDPPRTLLFVENAAGVKAALRVIRAVAEEFIDDSG